MKNLAFATIVELKQKLENKEITESELLSFFLNRLEKHNPELNAAIEVFDKDSIDKQSRQQGTLSGIPGLIKDNISQENRKLTAASKILDGYTATYDSTVTSRLKRQGALLAGRANLDEFAMGSSTETSAFGTSKNPWNLEYVPGGSSGGSAVAVAAGLVPWALGTDTGGSVRQPAGFCGIMGLKPTYGLVSRHGVIAYASSLDQVGIFARSAHDTAIVLSALAGQDVRDSSTLSVQKKDYTQTLDGSIKSGMTIGLIESMINAEGVDSEVHGVINQAVKDFEKLGVTVKKISLPILDYAASAYFIISRAEAASNLARFDGVRYGLRKRKTDGLEKMYNQTRHDGFGLEVRDRILVGNFVLSAGHSADFYQNAQMVQRMIRKDLDQAFTQVDLLLAPTQPAGAFKIGAYDKQNKLQMDLQDYFTCFVNLSGNPGMSVPGGFTADKLPIGFQLVGPHLSEGLMLQTAHAYQQVTDWHKKHPEQFVESE
ncbi:Asp-tRNA(Asn)/Glu-tRNA(Gln) amidotransferase subunit GatA [bacterium]|jgi:aspartyl-tRNA(Asn)/glutamyl-tRNA(Gln) amidotransferase subunit A|nr:Asp-tRNA(Asn)/Glu-tRNA(Gln) amidotransferase subunit GatA [bacterium]MBT5014845.1 Asp-tRNA(Asn)/Glu-tRNA(Gln) amidotransferase subunit GatA [bacterium]